MALPIVVYTITIPDVMPDDGGVLAGGCFFVSFISLSFVVFSATGLGDPFHFLNWNGIGTALASFICIGGVHL